MLQEEEEKGGRRSLAGGFVAHKRATALDTYRGGTTVGCGYLVGPAGRPNAAARRERPYTEYTLSNITSQQKGKGQGYWR